MRPTDYPISGECALGDQWSVVAGYDVPVAAGDGAPGEVVVGVAAVVVIALVVPARCGRTECRSGVGRRRLRWCRRGHLGGRLILLLLPEPAPDSTTSTIDLRLDDDRTD
jgi:hypothetical protein